MLATVATIVELFQWLLQPYRNQPSAVDGVLKVCTLSVQTDMHDCVTIIWK